jgi:hypothetical protein
MVGFKHLCRYCDKLVPANANVCPFCGKVNPVGKLRCPKCRNPVEKGWYACSHCGLRLEIICPQCGEKTFLSDYCSHCDARLVVVCKNKKCKTEQAPIADTCVKCGRPL